MGEDETQIDRHFFKSRKSFSEENCERGDVGGQLHKALSPFVFAFVLRGKKNIKFPGTRESHGVGSEKESTLAAPRRACWRMTVRVMDTRRGRREERRVGRRDKKERSVEEKKKKNTKDEFLVFLLVSSTLL